MNIQDQFPLGLTALISWPTLKSLLQHYSSKVLVSFNSITFSFLFEAIDSVSLLELSSFFFKSASLELAFGEVSPVL